MFTSRTSSAVFTDLEGAGYLAALAEAVADEGATRLSDGRRGIVQEARLLAADCARGARAGFSYAEWEALWRRYDRVCRSVAHGYNETANVSREYTSMEDFWEDAGKQVAGLSDYTFWDTYEHGRRRQIEQIFAASYGVESALLLNSGMSAVAVVVGSLNLQKGDSILTGERCYFETSEYLEKFVSACGIEVRRVAMDDPSCVIAALERFRPKLLLFETATNAHQPVAPHGFSRWPAAGPDTRIVVDNSVQSHATRWFEIQQKTGVPHLVIESAVKYLTHDCMAGVIYGNAADLERLREFARGTGQQLQEKAFNWIRPGEIQHASQRMLLHARNVHAFCEELGDSHGLAYIRTLAGNAGTDTDAAMLFQNGVGSLIYLALAGAFGADIPQARHRAVVNRWKASAEGSGFPVSVRAGFGWSRTSVRAYESSRLNQPDAPSYVRVSVGIEPEGAIRRLAQLLVETIADITSERVEIAYEQPC